MALSGVWLVVLGILAIPSLLLSKRPDAKDLLAKIQPYQGWMGVVSAFWGLWQIISAVLAMGRMLGSVPILWATYLADAVLLAALGILLGVGTAKTFIKEPTAQAKMDEVAAKLAPHQGRLGLVAVCVGLWLVVASLFIWHA